MCSAFVERKHCFFIRDGTNALAEPNMREWNVFVVTLVKRDQLLYICLFTCQVNSPEREIYRDPDIVRSEDKLDDLQVMKTNTAKKMLSIFRQLEENAAKEDIPDGREPRMLCNICSLQNITLRLQMCDFNYFWNIKTADTLLSVEFRCAYH